MTPFVPGRPWCPLALRVRPITAALVVAYTGYPAPLACHDMELKLMMEPPPFFFIPGRTAWQVKNIGRWLMAMRSSK